MPVSTTRPYLAETMVFQTPERVANRRWGMQR